MSQFSVAIFLSVFVTMPLVCEMRSQKPTKRPKTCDFPHKGNGGVLDEKQNYIKDSVLVWVDVAKKCFDYVIDQRGNTALNDWIDASEKFNTAMQNGNEEEAFKSLDQANESFEFVAPFIGKEDLSMYFKKVHKELGELLKAKNLQDINDYMVKAYPQFRKHVGCPIAQCDNAML